MSEDQFDVIVVGAGMAGLGCAAELVLRGKRPLLVCETKEVAQTLHTVWVDGNRGLMHHPSIQVGWGGGWWTHLVRQLNVDVNVRHFCPTIDATVRGSGVISHLPAACFSAKSMVKMFTTFCPIPLDGITDALEKVIHAALAIPFEELLTMDRVPFATWLEEQGADELISMLLLTFAGQVSILTADEARQYLSVLGALGPLRTMICGEAILCAIEPDAREGMAIPIAREIERRGGEVWRGRKVAKVLIEEGRASGVQLIDGTEVHAPIVAIAAGNPRIPALFDQVPPELEAPLAYKAGTDRREFCLFAVLDKPLVPPRGGRYLAVMNSDFSFLQWEWPLHEIAPWSTKEGQQFLVSERLIPQDKVDAMGGDEAVYEDILAVNEELYPGFRSAIVDMVKDGHKHHWLSPLHVGPKIPRTVESVPGLWFVGDGSTPIGAVYSEAATSAGILGARAMCGSKSTMPVPID